MVTDELDVRTTEEQSEILIVHQIIGPGFLQDSGKQNGAVVPYIVMAGDIINVATELLDGFGGKTLAVNLSENTIQTGRLGLDSLFFGNETLFFTQGGFSSSHIRVSFSIHTPGWQYSYAYLSSFSRSG